MAPDKYKAAIPDLKERKKSQMALSAGNIQRYLTNLSSHHSPASIESGKAFSRKFIGKNILRHGDTASVL